MPEALAFLPALGAGALDLAPGAVSVISIGGLTQVVGLSSFLSSAAGTLFQIGLAIGAGELANLLTPSPKLQSQQQTVNDSIVPRRRGVGRVKIAGVRMLWENTSGGRCAGLYFCEGPVSTLEYVYFNDEAGVLSGETVTSPMGGHALFEYFPGTTTQSASTIALARATDWTSAYQLKGCCYGVGLYGSVKQKDFIGNYKAGEPTVRLQITLDAVWDPRDPAQSASDDPYAPTTWVWNDNAALGLLHYLMHPQGHNQPLAAINVASFISMANRCDEAINVKAGGTEKRYRAWGTWDLNEEPQAVIKRFLDAMDGELLNDSLGCFLLRGGGWDAPTVTIDNSAIITHEFSETTGAMLAFTRIQQSYVSPPHDFKMTPGDPWIDSAAEAAFGELPPATLPLDMVPSHGQSRRLAKIFLATKNPAIKGRISTNAYGLNAIGERIITIIDADLDINISAKITKMTFAGDLSSCTIDYIAVSSDMYDWDYEAEEGTAPIVPPTDSMNGETVETPTISSITQNSIQSSGAYAATLTVNVNAPTYTSYTLNIQWRIVGSANWLQASANQGVWTCDTGILQDGQTYEVQAAFQSTTTVQSAWTASSDFVIVADPTAPGPPTTFSVTNLTGGAGALLSATAPNSSNFSRLRFLRNTTATLSTATLLTTPVYGAPSASLSLADPVSPGVYYYWVHAENASEVASSTVGPVAVTTT